MVVALKANWEAHRFAVEDNIYAIFAQATSSLHRFKYFGYEFFDCEGLQGHHDTTF